MPKLFSLLLIFLPLMLIFSLAYAQSEPFTIEIMPSRAITEVGAQMTFEAKVTNNLQTGTTAELTWFADKNFGWFTNVGSVIKNIEPGKTESFSFILLPPWGSPSQDFPFQVIICKKDDAAVCSKKDVFVKVVQKIDLSISSFKLIKSEVKEGEAVKAIVVIKNTGGAAIEGAKLLIKTDVGEKSVELPTLEREKDNIADVDIDFKFKTETTYNITIRLIDNLKRVQDEKSAIFSVKEIPVGTKYKQEKVVTPGLFIKRTSITLNNIDYEEHTIKVYEPVERCTLLYYFKDARPSIEKIEGEKYFVWSCKLAPAGQSGDKCLIQYNLHLWLLYLAAFLTLLALIVAAIEYEKPKIKKHSSFKMGKHTIHIEIKNNSLKDLTEVEVVDKIPSVVQREGAYSIKPAKEIIKPDGIQVSWHIGTLKPKEERVISYNVKPVFEVEEGIKLPPAHVKAKNFRGKIDHVKSPAVVIK